MIQFRGVSKIYPVSPVPVVALDKVSFEVDPGEFVFLVGPSGSGKTTILRLLTREELPSAGRIFFDDNEVTKLNRGGVYRLRRQIGVIFQDYKLLENKNAAENISFAMEAAGMSSKEIRETVPYVLEIVNLSDRAAAFPHQLSGGEKQRVAIARAIANNPKLLIADEPTGNLDPESAWDIVQILEKINKWGTTILMSTHGTDIVNTLRKRVIQMEDGVLIRDEQGGNYKAKAKDKDTDQEKGEAESEDKEKIVISTDKDKDTEEKLEEKEEKAETEEKEVKTDAKESESEAKQDEEEKASAKEEDSEVAELAVAPEIPTAKLADAEEETQTLAAADNVGLTALKLSEKMVEKLEASGYKDIEDILSAGVAKVNKSLNKQEIRLLARAIKRYLTAE